MFFPCSDCVYAVYLSEKSGVPQGHPHNTFEQYSVSVCFHSNQTNKQHYKSTSFKIKVDLTSNFGVVRHSNTTFIVVCLHGNLPSASRAVPWNEEHHKELASRLVQHVLQLYAIVPWRPCLITQFIIVFLLMSECKLH